MTSSLDRNFNDAREYFQKALSFKESIYSDCDHVEVVVEILALAQAERSLGNIPAAMQLFSRARITTSRLLDHSSYSDQQFKVVDSLLLSLYCLRNLEKLLGNTVKAAALDKEARRLKKKFNELSKKEPDSSIGLGAGIVKALLDCRHKVRVLAARMKKDTDYPLVKARKEVAKISLALNQIRSECHGGGPLESGILFSVDCMIDNLSAACKAGCCSYVVQALYDASDSFRSQLRDMGFKVSDLELSVEMIK